MGKHRRRVVSPAVAGPCVHRWQLDRLQGEHKCSRCGAVAVEVWFGDRLQLQLFAPSVLSAEETERALREVIELLAGGPCTHQHVVVT